MMVVITSSGILVALSVGTLQDGWPWLLCMGVTTQEKI